MRGQKKPDKMSRHHARRVEQFRAMAEVQLERLGVAIQDARERRGWSRSRLAREIPVDTKTVERWEKALTGGAMDNLGKIAEALGTTADELLAASLPERQHNGRSPLDALSPDADQSDRIEAKLDEVLDRLTAMSARLRASDVGQRADADRPPSQEDQPAENRP